jgi:hypothetical protein
MNRGNAEDEGLVHIRTGTVTLDGNLLVPDGATGIVLFAHGSGSSRFSTRNRRVAEFLREGGLLHSRAASFRQADGNGLLRRSRPVLSLANVIDLLANEFSRLRRRSLSFSFIFSCTPQRFSLRHLRILLQKRLHRARQHDARIPELNDVPSETRALVSTQGRNSKARLRLWRLDEKERSLADLGGSAATECFFTTTAVPDPLPSTAAGCCSLRR